MQEQPKFEVFAISSERSIDGYTTVQLRCIQDNVYVNIVMKNAEVTKELVKSLAVEAYKRYYTSIEDTKDNIKTGDIL